MSEDAKAIVLLCGRLGDRAQAEPLRQREYGRLVRWLLDGDLRPSALLDPALVPAAAAGSGLPEQRLSTLLGRGVQLGFVVEKWNQSGLWVICRSDPDYPSRLKTHLGDRAPPVLYGAGDRELLPGGGLAVVGSRNVDEEGRAVAREVAAWCARGGVNVVSGGARGVDRIAMDACLDGGGVVVGVLADNLLEKSVARTARDALADGRLLLISPCHPEARFTVGTAMGRNKLIYGMADYGFVVGAEEGRGGTWSGATEELGRRPGRPVFVRRSGSVPAGNERLLELGALVFPDWNPQDDPSVVLAGGAAVSEGGSEALSSRPEQTLFDYARSKSGASGSVSESLPEVSPAPATTPPQSPPPPASVYEAVLPLILSALDETRSLAELASQLDVARGQVQIWLKRAEEEAEVRKLLRPVRYIRRGR